MSDYSTKLRDALGAAGSYLHSLDVMADALLAKGDNADYVAFCLIIESAKKEIEKGHLVVDDMEAGE